MANQTSLLGLLRPGFDPENSNSSMMWWVYLHTHTPHFISIYIDGLPACVWRLEEGVSPLELELEPIMNHGHVGASFLHFPAWR